MTTTASLPVELPEKPENWGQSLIVHMNMGSKGHVAQFQITDDKGVVMPFVRRPRPWSCSMISRPSSSRPTRDTTKASAPSAWA